MGISPGLRVHLRRRSLFFRSVAAGVLTLTLGTPLLSFAQATIDNELLLADEEFIAYESMDQAEIQAFLEAKGSVLRSFYSTLDTGETVLASDLIFRASRNHRVNPQFLLALLQKEQGLIEDPAPVSNQFDWATGYGCLDNQPCNERWRGFHKQINSAAEQFRYYFEHIDEYQFRPGKTSSVDGQLITPKNIITAAMYNYTPHVQGNRLMKALWTKYFESKLPDGTLMQVAGEPGVWLVQNGMKRAFTSRLALVSRYNPNLIVTVNATDLDSYERGANIDFAAFSLLKSSTSGTIYLLTSDQKRAISSQEVFRTLGFNPEEVEDATDEQLAAIPDGRPITISDAYPTGSVLADKTTGDMFYVESGRKYPIVAKEILTINFPKATVTKVASDTLDKYSNGLAVQLKDGSLIKGTNAEVYVISNSKKRHITSEKVFNTIGYKWGNIIVVSDKVLELHPTGDPFVLNN